MLATSQILEGIFADALRFKKPQMCCFITVVSKNVVVKSMGRSVTCKRAMIEKKLFSGGAQEVHGV
jgi:hypothetical protein